MSPTTINPHQKIYKERERRHLIENLFYSSSPANTGIIPQIEQGQNSRPEHGEHETITEIPVTADNENIEMEVLLEKYKKLQEKNSHILEVNRKQKLEIESLNKKLSSANSNVSLLERQKDIQQILCKVFSKSQLDLLTKKKKKVQWSSDDISKAFALRYLSKRCYLYVRNTLHYPLPHVSTLQKWASRLNFQEGILNGILKFMKIAALKMSELEKVCVMQYDEMKVHSVYEYDKVNDEVLGPHSQMQVIMVRGLFKSWKQPIYIKFDQKITVDIINQPLLTALHNIKYAVVACVSDCGGANVGLLKDLNVSTEKTYFLHHVTSQKVFMFADVPHLLKLKLVD